MALFLEDVGDKTKKLPVYDRGKPYACFHDLQGKYGCGEFVDGRVLTLEGVYAKGKEPEQSVGSASPGGGSTPPRVVSYRDFYFFDLGSPAADSPAGARAVRRGR